MHQTKVRNLIAAVEGDLKKLESADAGKAETALRASWGALVADLNVGPEPATRACPFCKKLIMRDATRCLHCWAKSKPPGEA